MNKVTDKQKEQVFEMKQGWLAVVIFLVLGYSRFLVEDWFGKGWAVVAAAIAAAIWFVIRPWRFGLLSERTRRGFRLTGSMALCGFVVLAALSYWRYGRH